MTRLRSFDSHGNESMDMQQTARRLRLRGREPSIYGHFNVRSPIVAIRLLRHFERIENLSATLLGCSVLEGNFRQGIWNTVCGHIVDRLSSFWTPTRSDVICRKRPQVWPKGTTALALAEVRIGCPRWMGAIQPIRDSIHVGKRTPISAPSGRNHTRFSTEADSEWNTICKRHW